MAKNVEHILHKRNSGNTAPSTDSIEYGEIAINYKAGSEKIYIKNSDGTIVPFSPNGGGPAPEISISGGTSGVSATANGMTLGVVTNGGIVKLDNFEHDQQKTTTGYTNESAVTSSSGYDAIIDGGTGQTVNSAISKLENEIINLWKMLGKNDFDKNYYGVKTVYDLISATPVAPAISISGGTSGVSATASGMTLGVVTNGDIVKLDNFQHDPRNAESGYTNEGNVTASTEYDSIVSGGTGQTVNSAISKLENEIISLWKMLGKNDFDKTHYGTTVHNLVSLDNFQHDPRNAESGYTNEGHVTASTEYDSIISDNVTARTVSSSISKLENEIVNLWKMLGKKDFDKTHYGTTVHNLVSLDNFEHDPRNAESGYTNEGHVTASTEYDSIISDSITARTVSSSISKLENEIINLWKMLGKKDFDKNYYGVKTVYDLISATPVAPAISISGGTSGVSATSSGMTLGIVTNGGIVKLDNYAPQAQTADSGYTNESAVTSSSRYDLIVSGGTGFTVNNAISQLENEIINLWKMLGKKDFDKNYYGVKTVYDLISATPVAPAISISGGTSGVSATSSGMTLGIVTNGDIVKLDNFQHDSQTAGSGYTNESAVTSSTQYDVIISGGTGQTVNSAISKLENEIINLWKMLGKKDFDKEHYGTSIYDLLSDSEYATSTALRDLNDRVIALETKVANLETTVNNNRIIIDYLISKGL